MSLLKNFSPSRTREKGREPKDSNIKLSEARVGPVQKTLDPQGDNPRQDMIEQYSYNKEDIKSKKQEIEKPVAPSEQYSLAQKEQPVLFTCPTFGLFELTLKCEEHLLISLYGPQDRAVETLNNMRKEYLHQRLEAISETKQRIELNSFKDWMYMFKGEVIIVEELKPLTGFFREYFGIENIYIFYDSGELILEPTGYCTFWTKRRLDTFFSGRLRELSHTEIENSNNCLKCLWNSNCPFSRVQQMSK